MSNASPVREITGKRPTNVSRWHRLFLPEWCYVTDGDWFEQRSPEGELKTVAYIETIQMREPRRGAVSHPVWSAKEALCLEIERKMGIPAYVVWHNPKCDSFVVHRITESTAKKMNHQQYAQFIEGLKPPQ